MSVFGTVAIVLFYNKSNQWGVGTSCLVDWSRVNRVGFPGCRCCGLAVSICVFYTNTARHMLVTFYGTWNVDVPVPRDHEEQNTNKKRSMLDTFDNEYR